MESNKYLPVGSIIGGHYETVDVLGEDDFEILYLVRDNHRRGSFFVLKELFLEVFSSRNQKVVYTIPQAQGVFDKRKEEIILDIENAKRNRQIDEVKTYGYVEENDTIYTIMQFTNNSDLTNYLQFQAKDEMSLPSLEEILANPKKEKKSSIFLKILIITVIVGVVLALYANKIIQEDRDKAEEKNKITVTQEPIHHPRLTNRRTTDLETSKELIEDKLVEETVEKEVIAVIKEETLVVEDKKPLENASLDGFVEEEELISLDLESEESPIIEESKTLQPPLAPIIQELELPTTAISLGKEIKPFERETHNPENNAISLGTKIEPKRVNNFSRASIQKFLNTFIASSASGSVEDIASQYDYHVDRYFSLNNVTHSTIKKDKRRYNKKWIHRSFTIDNFTILKIYTKDNTNYCDLKTTTKWHVSTNSGKKASGRSRGFMTIKQTDNGFKVKSIYTLK